MISLGLAVATEEQIWDEVDVALMETIDDPMGPIFTGRFNERYLLPASSQMHPEKKLTVPSSEQTVQSSGTIKFSLPLHVLSIKNESDCTCSSSKCECRNQNEWTPRADWLLDSGASLHFTPYLEDFASLKELNKSQHELVHTAKKDMSLKITGKGSVILEHNVDNPMQPNGKFIRISPVYYIKGLSIQLLSLRTFLHDGCYVKGLDQGILLAKIHKGVIFLHCVNTKLPDKLYYACTIICSQEASSPSMSTLSL